MPITDHATPVMLDALWDTIGSSDVDDWRTIAEYIASLHPNDWAPNRWLLGLLIIYYDAPLDVLPISIEGLRGPRHMYLIQKYAGDYAEGWDGLRFLVEPDVMDDVTDEAEAQAILRRLYTPLLWDDADTSDWLKDPMLCIREDGTVGRWIDPRQTTMFGGTHAHI